LVSDDANLFYCKPVADKLDQHSVVRYLLT
jgi:hypothetical protein